MTELLKPQEVADLLDVDPATVRRWVSTRSLPAVKIGGQVLRFERSAVLDWLQQYQTAAQ